MEIMIRDIFFHRLLNHSLLPLLPFFYNNTENSCFLVYKVDNIMSLSTVLFYYLMMQNHSRLGWFYKLFPSAWQLFSEVFFLLLHHPGYYQMEIYLQIYLD